MLTGNDGKSKHATITHEMRKTRWEVLHKKERKSLLDVAPSTV